MESDDFEDVDGIVTEITLHTVKVRNWNRTQVCLPICYLVNKPFVNYTAMIKGGGRRIKRAVLIDQRSIRFLTPEEVESLKGFDILKDYLEDKEKEIAQYNAGRSPFNTRYLTNLGVFRIYAKRYLEHHPKIRGDLTLFVRELAPTSTDVTPCWCKIHANAISANVSPRVAATSFQRRISCSTPSVSMSGRRNFPFDMRESSGIPLR